MSAHVRALEDRCAEIGWTVEYGQIGSGQPAVWKRGLALMDDEGTMRWCDEGDHTTDVAQRALAWLDAEHPR